MGFDTNYFLNHGVVISKKKETSPVTDKTSSGKTDAKTTGKQPVAADAGKTKDAPAETSPVTDKTSSGKTDAKTATGKKNNKVS